MSCEDVWVERTKDEKVGGDGNVGNWQEEVTQGLQMKRNHVSRGDWAIRKENGDGDARRLCGSGFTSSSRVIKFLIAVWGEVLLVSVPEEVRVNCHLRGTKGGKGLIQKKAACGPDRGLSDLLSVRWKREGEERQGGAFYAG